MDPTTFAQCMDVFDWFDDPLFSYLNHVLLAKLDGEARIMKALPELITWAKELVKAHAGTDNAYPTLSNHLEEEHE